MTRVDYNVWRGEYVDAMPLNTFDVADCRADAMYPTGRVIDPESESDAISLSSLPVDMLWEMSSHCSPREMTTLCRVSGLMRAAFRRHPLITALREIAPSAYYVAVVAGLTSVQSAPLHFRPCLLREYAYRMTRIRDGDASVPWRAGLTLCQKQLHDQADLPLRYAGLRDLMVAKSVALLRIESNPMQRHYVINECELRICDVPVPYRPDVIDVLLALNPTTHSYDQHILLLNAHDAPLLERPPIRVIALMAALTLFESTAENVCHHVMRRFDVTLEERDTLLEPLVVDALATRFPRSGFALAEILRRWSMRQQPLIAALHEAFLQKAAASTRRSLTDFLDVVVPEISAGVRARAAEDVLAMPVEAALDLQRMPDVIPQFWTFYWAHGAVSSFRSYRTYWRAILQMPWQMQPTLLARLASRTDVLVLMVDDGGEAVDGLMQWEKRLVKTCMEHAMPRLAVRALLVSYQLTARQNYAGKAAVLQRVLALTIREMPPWSWGELMEVLCENRLGMKLSIGDTWPVELDIAACLTVFLCDPESWMIAPSPVFVGSLVRLLDAVWSHLPDTGATAERRLEAFCDRFDLLERDRWIVRASLARRLTDDLRKQAN